MNRTWDCFRQVVLYRQEFIRRMNKGEMQLDTLAAITSLKNENAAWRDIGSPASTERVWKYMSFTLKEKAPRFFTPPAGMESGFKG